MLESSSVAAQLAVTKEGLVFSLNTYLRVSKISIAECTWVLTVKNPKFL
jgi:hypothetical protein